ncbi:diaminohydroxyphosphoribosylaminopyrimidine deaminase/5-amino-6-(5-phosphoribosylamino)uracil reductase [Anaerosolibacter carboniphilus]|uniref:Riboflavin biosynthesis protein RibD n=1 Tax=Anaerosolibacter carboniphilus TaxID=1417629 RepID=A0A841KT52_9FIRM|nr:bifunctional diaminohydroxyphosphoribosylaminopyrimidine deaminase/5-amino-6-(5-phosphoribosylamino)uracil reductase RibD [Anaerosolibacter carboniphilus]MBB6216776.1 diaminohydroxyphosphoribosylaminopyrimidine deaminase/5-amino-6-(5-phosphoribosylamino)uracil reductase [Anaerosolibacter carboniphilus]
MEVKYMSRALALAREGIGYTSPNPLVGAVIVKEGRIIGEGYHQLYGGPHAEINAFENAAEDVYGATMYVTLEPCSHYGKTPPCANAIVEKGIKKVVIAMMDPNPLVAGKGIDILKTNGIEVVTGILEDEAKKTNEIFIKYITTGSPFCLLKTAMTLDGKIAAYTGDSKWITNEKSRGYVHQLRHQYRGIMVGIGTVLADDPMLTTRLDAKEGCDPVRIVVDSRGRIPLNAQVLHVSSQARTVIATTDQIPQEKLIALQQLGAEVILLPSIQGQVSLPDLMKALGERKIDSILLEGGSTLNYTALDAGIVDKVMAFISPKILGGSGAKTPVGGQGKSLVKDAVHLKNISINRFEEDILIEGYVDR